MKKIETKRSSISGCLPYSWAGYVKEPLRIDESSKATAKSLLGKK